MRANFFISVLLGISISTILVACATAGKYTSPDQWVAESRQGDNLILAEKADVWSEPKVYAIEQTKVQVRSKFLELHGSTCHYSIEVTNLAESPADDSFALAKPNTAATYGHLIQRLKIEPGKTKLWKDLEVRECAVQLGTTKDPNLCASCNPRFVFIRGLQR